MSGRGRESRGLLKQWRGFGVVSTFFQKYLRFDSGQNPALTLV